MCKGKIFGYLPSLRKEFRFLRLSRHLDQGCHSQERGKEKSCFLEFQGSLHIPKLEKKNRILCFSVATHCLKITQNVAFKF
mgnify:CR=1 FL=1